MVEILKLSGRRKSFKNGQKLTYHFLQILNLIKTDDSRQSKSNKQDLGSLLVDYAKRSLFTSPKL